eukprot:278330_1
MSDLEEQLQEFESIQSIYDKDKLSFDQTIISKLQSIINTNNIQNKQSNTPHLTFTLLITNQLSIECTLPSKYPSTTAPILFIRSLSSKYSKSSIENANHLLKSRIDQQFEPGNLLLFELFDWIQENIPTVIKVANFNNNSFSKMRVNKLNLQRSFLWFHHIRRKKKKANMLAKQYKLTGFCVSGKPGVIVAEGMAENVKAYVTELKTWSWKRMIVRHTENELCNDLESYKLKQRYKNWIIVDIQCDEKGGMKHVYDLLKKGNLESYYKMIVHINTPIDCNQ